MKSSSKSSDVKSTLDNEIACWESLLCEMENLPDWVSNKLKPIVEYDMIAQLAKFRDKNSKCTIKPPRIISSKRTISCVVALNEVYQSLTRKLINKAFDTMTDSDLDTIHRIADLQWLLDEFERLAKAMSLTMKSMLEIECLS